MPLHSRSRTWRHRTFKPQSMCRTVLQKVPSRTRGECVATANASVDSDRWKTSGSSRQWSRVHKMFRHNDWASKLAATPDLAAQEPGNPLQTSHPVVEPLQIDMVGVGQTWDTPSACASSCSKLHRPQSEKSLVVTVCCIWNLKRIKDFRSSPNSTLCVLTLSVSDPLSQRYAGSAVVWGPRCRSTCFQWRGLGWGLANLREHSSSSSEESTMVLLRCAWPLNLLVVVKSTSNSFEFFPPPSSPPHHASQPLHCSTMSPTKCSATCPQYIWTVSHLVSHESLF